MKADFNFYLSDLSGKEMKEAHAGKILAGVLSQHAKGDAIKLFDWALKFYNEQPAEVDDSDYSTLYKFVENCENLTALAKAQLLRRLKEQK